MRFRDFSTLVLLLFVTTFTITYVHNTSFAIEETPPQGIIVYDSDLSGLAEVIRMNVNGTNSVMLTDGTEYPCAKIFAR